MVAKEEKEQAMLFSWALDKSCEYPELGFMFAIPNGGYRAKKTAMKLKKQGVKRGVPDICLPVMRGGFGGMYIEMKREKGGVLSLAQEAYLAYLRTEGYYVCVCRGYLEAVAEIIGYLER